MKIIRRITLIILMFIAINHSFSQDSPKSDTIITRKIKLNKTFSLGFKTCHTCGYNWIIDNKYDSTKLKFIGLTTTKNPKQKIGGYETESWSFQVLKKENIN